MSSVKSALKTLPPDLVEPLVQATASVCETSFFAFTEPASAEVLAQIPAEESWFHSIVDFTGPMSGRVTVMVPSGLARELFGAFLGFDENDVYNNAELHDMVGEFGNMVCGTWLTSLGREQCFDLAHPEVVLGGIPAPDEHGIVLAVNDRPVLVRAEVV
ncbi:MAG: chemotaxis protein CheX [Vicinamibacterales bacterium]